MDILTNRTVKTSKHYSRYNGLNMYYNKHDGKYQLALKSWLRPNFNYTKYVVGKDETLDYIALKFYNNPTYYWIICDANKILDPTIEPEEGTTLIIPSLDSALQFEVY